MSRVTVNIAGSLPDELMANFLQQVRTFDASHPGCHFQIRIVSDQSTEAAKALLEGLDPPIPVVGVIARGKQS